MRATRLAKWLFSMAAFVWIVCLSLCEAARAIGAALPAEQLVFASSRTGNDELYLLDVRRMALINLTRHPADDSDPAWSPSGDQIAFVSNRDDGSELYVMSETGKHIRRLTMSDDVIITPAWSPDGTQIAFSANHNGKVDIYVLDLRTDTARNLTAGDESNNSFPVWSPDGAEIAYTSWIEAGSAIYHIVLENGDIRPLITNQYLSSQPEWSPDGAQIAYVSGTGRESMIAIANAQGVEQGALGGALRINTNNFQPAWSAAGGIAFVSDRDGNWEIYLTNRTGSFLHRLTNHAANDWFPAWRPQPGAQS